MDLSFSEITSFLSLIISCFAAYIAKSSSNKANSISNENLKLQKNNLNLQYGMVELEISQSIENAKSKINEIEKIKSGGICFNYCSNLVSRKRYFSVG